MPSTYTTNLGLEKPATGEQAGTWGNTANASYDFLDTATDGNLAIALSSSAYTLTTNQGADSQGRNKVIIFTGVLSANATISIAPTSARKLYFFQNKTSGGFALIIQQGTGSVFTLQNGYSAVVYCNGAGATASVNGVLSNLQADTLLVQALATFQAGLTAAAPVTLNLGSDAAYDLHYRSVAGPLARLANGTAGQLLSATATGPQWITQPPSMAVGAPVSGGQANQVFFGGAGGILTQNSLFAFTASGLGVGIASPAHSLHVGAFGGLAEVYVDGAAGASTVRRIILATGAFIRGTLTLSQENETGSDVGSNLLLLTYNDLNSQATQHMVCFRASHNTSLGSYVDLGGRVNVVGMVASQVPLIVRGAAGQAVPLQTWQNSAAAAVASIDNSGNCNIAGQYQVNGVPFTAGITIYNTSGAFIGTRPNLLFTAGAGLLANCTDTPGFAGGPAVFISYVTTSDARLKRNVAPLSGGLSVVERLRPYEFEYNGLGGTIEGERGVSIMAQDLQEILPESVWTYRAKLRSSDAEPMEFLTFSPHEVTYHLVLAVQQLSQAVKQLQQRT